MAVSSGRPVDVTQPGLVVEQVIQIVIGAPPIVLFPVRRANVRMILHPATRLAMVPL